MGNQYSSIKINYEDIQFIIKNNLNNNYLIINTLEINSQDCLIYGTLNINDEELFINNCLKNGEKNKNIIIYGKNCNDEKLEIKYKQLISLGFYNVYIYNGGLFEWLLLQDIYGDDEFPTTKKELNILKFKPNNLLNRLNTRFPLLEVK
jgi:hypothetical protein